MIFEKGPDRWEVEIKENGRRVGGCYPVDAFDVVKVVIEEVARIDRMTKNDAARKED